MIKFIVDGLEILEYWKMNDGVIENFIKEKFLF